MIAMSVSSCVSVHQRVAIAVGALRGTARFAAPTICEGARPACRCIVLGIILLASAADASIVSRGGSDDQDEADLKVPSPAAMFSIDVQHQPDSDDKIARLKWANGELRIEIQKIQAKYR